MRVATMAPCLYPDRSRIRLLDESARKHMIALCGYGVGDTFYGWKNMLTHYTLPVMERFLEQGYTHVLYVDGIDSIFMSGLDEIIAKYDRYGNPPMLMSADGDKPQINSLVFAGRRPWAFLNAGGWIGEIKFICEQFEVLNADYGDHDADYQNWFVKAWPRFGVEVDHDCSIFQSMNGEPYLRPMGKRVLNAVTGTWPSVLHFRGGYCDPETGRESRILPFLKEIEQS